MKLKKINYNIRRVGIEWENRGKIRGFKKLCKPNEKYKTIEEFKNADNKINSNISSVVFGPKIKVEGEKEEDVAEEVYEAFMKTNPESRQSMSGFAQRIFSNNFEEILSELSKHIDITKLSREQLDEVYWNTICDNEIDTSKTANGVAATVLAILNIYSISKYPKLYNKAKSMGENNYEEEIVNNEQEEIKGIEGVSKADFTGKLRGEDVTLKNVKTKEVTYVKRYFKNAEWKLIKVYMD